MILATGVGLLTLTLITAMFLVQDARRERESRAAVAGESDSPKIDSYVFWHNRATDIVLIGPFATVDDAWVWWNEHGQHNGVSPALTHVRTPGTTYNSIWGLVSETVE